MKKFRLLMVQLLAVIILVGCFSDDDTVPVGGKETESIKDKEITTWQETTTEESTTEEPTTEEPTTVDAGIYDFTLCFAGDISLEENAVTTKLLDASPNGLKDCISPELLKIMNEADVMCVNNEFTYSTRGEPIPNKMWTFRADPSRINYLHEMGVDIVLLANNHVYDYGPDAMIDTLDTLKGAGIEYFGAGRNLEEAMKPVYIEIGGKTIAYVAASRAEKYKLTPQATENSPGILKCYDPELFLQVIREADANADFVIANVHWGTERSDVLEEAQLQRESSTLMQVPMLSWVHILIVCKELNIIKVSR